MKHILLFSLLTAIACSLVNAQIINPADALKRKVNNRINNKIDQGLDKGLDEAEEAAKRKKAQEDSAKAAQSGLPAGNTAAGDPQTGSAPTFKTYSKYDFISGDKVQAMEDFSQDALGDFPDKWNTNSTGELVTLEGQTGKWLQLTKKGVFMPEFITELPENFTFEFDLAVNPNFSFYSSPFYVNFAALKTPATYADWMVYGRDRTGLNLSLHPTGAGNQEGSSEVVYYASANHEETMRNNLAVNQFAAHLGKTVVHISIWRQKQRLRVYVNEEKIWDLPRVFETGVNYNAIVFALGDLSDPADKYLLSNLKLAIGAPDTRHKLITEGKFVSHGILFDVNSATVKPESYGAIKDIAAVLKENPDLKIKIIGHTDSDGDDKSNLELSKKRAEAVRQILMSEFGIDASRLQTDGKGESEPQDKSDTKEAKANNRRVEFLKI